MAPVVSPEAVPRDLGRRIARRAQRNVAADLSISNGRFGIWSRLRGPGPGVWADARSLQRQRLDMNRRR